MYWINLKKKTIFLSQKVLKTVIAFSIQNDFFIINQTYNTIQFCKRYVDFTAIQILVSELEMI